MSTNGVSLNVNGLVLTSVKDVQGALKDGKITEAQAKRFCAMFEDTPPDLDKGVTVQSNPSATPLSPEEQAARDAANAKQQEDIANMKAAASPSPAPTESPSPAPAASLTPEDIAQAVVEEDGVTTSEIKITSHGNGTYTSDIEAPTQKKEKTTKADEKARMARYYDEEKGEWIQQDETHSAKDVKKALNTKKKEIKREKKQATKDHKQAIKDLKKATLELAELRAKCAKGEATQEQVAEAEARVRELSETSVKRATDRDAAKEELSQVTQAHKAAKGKGIGGDTKAYNDNVKVHNRLVDRVVVFSEPEAKAAKKDPNFEGKDIKVATTKDLMVLQQLSATAQRHMGEASSPQEKALWSELAGIFKDEEGKDLPLDKVDTKKVQDALIDLTGGDMKLNYTEQQIIAQETGMSMSDVRHAFKTYGFEAPNPVGKRIVNGLKEAAPVVATMGLSYLLTKSKSHAEASSSAESHADAYAESTVTERVGVEATATAHAEAETPGIKFDWTDPYTGEEIHKRVAGQFVEDTQTVTEYAEAVATATAKAEAHADAFATATAACEAVAVLSPYALVAAPVLAFLAGATKSPVEISATKAGATTQKMAAYVEVYKKNKNKNIGNQIVQMAGQITGNKEVDRALIVAVLDHDIGSQNTTPTTRELRNALAHLDAIKQEVDKFKQLPPPQPPTEPPTEVPTVPPTEAPTECPTVTYTEDREYIHKRKAGDTWTGLVQAYYPDCIGTHSISECIRELKRQLAYDDNGVFQQDVYQALLRGSDIPKELKMPEKIFDCDINKDGQVKAQKIKPGRGGKKALDKAGRKYTDYYKEDCHNKTKISKEEYERMNEE